MADWGFWAAAFGLGLAVALVLVSALRRTSVRDAGGAEDLAVYRDQLAEVERDLARGTIGVEDAARLRAEVGKRVLEADRIASQGQPGGDSGRIGKLAPALLVLTLPAALLAYWVLGAPGYPDMALGPRIAALDAGIASRPSQEAELAALKVTRDAAQDGKLATELAPMTDPAALRELFRTRFEAGALQAAVRVQERVLALEGDKAGSADHANLALALVAEAQGYVSPEAEAELRASLQKDMTNELARYLVGEMFLQGGRYDQAFRFWRPLAEEGDPAAPWTQSIRDRIVEVAGMAGIRYSLPDAQGSLAGPSAGDMAAAGEMSPEDRQKMIEGMVAQLSDRLATDGGTVEEWNRLIRSLAVLERKPEAQKIYDEAKTKFAGQSAELSFLKLAAVESGLVP
jgi:cytochrome c-type biogenesis protein CcmH